MQAGMLIALLARDRPGDLAEAYRDAMARAGASVSNAASTGRPRPGKGSGKWPERRSGRAWRQRSAAGPRPWRWSA